MTTPTREENRIRIVREIPLWGVITGLIAFLMMLGAAAYNQFSGQQRLLELMTAQGAAIQELTIKVAQLSIQINGKDLKDVEHDVRLNDLSRRITDNEQLIRLLSRESKSRP